MWDSGWGLAVMCCCSSSCVARWRCCATCPAALVLAAHLRDHHSQPRPSGPDMALLGGAARVQAAAAPQPPLLPVSCHAADTPLHSAPQCPARPPKLGPCRIRTVPALAQRQAYRHCSHRVMGITAELEGRQRTTADGAPRWAARLSGDLARGMREVLPCCCRAELLWLSGVWHRSVACSIVRELLCPRCCQLAVPPSVYTGHRR